MNLQTEQLRRQRLEMLANEIDPINAPVPSPVPYKEMMKKAREVYTYCTPLQYPELFDMVPALYSKIVGPMHCEHIVAYYASRRRLKGIRFDAYNKMAREYRKAARDADYAATCWRPTK